MLSELLVNNYTLIRGAKLDFASGFTAITGETGAGKSILLGALGLVKGDRAESITPFDKEKKVVIEATFQVDAYGLKNWFVQQDLDYDSTCLIRREINTSGKSRAFVNDTPVTLSVLKELGAFLIDIHGQHETQWIAKSAYQLAVLDAFAQNQDKLDVFQKQFSEFLKLKSDIQVLKDKIEEALQNQSFNEFQLNELREAKLNKNDSLEELEEQLSVVENAQQIVEYLSLSSAVLSEERGVIELTQQLKQYGNKLAGFSSAYADLQSRIESISIELNDLSGEIEELAGKVEVDEEQKGILAARVDMLNTLLSKHRKSSVAELCELQEELEANTHSTESWQEELAEKEKELTKLEGELRKQATELHQARAKAAEVFEKQVQQQLSRLSMPNAEIRFELVELNTVASLGSTEVKLLVKANKGLDFQAIEKSASGGELSRIMLCLKSGVAQKKQLPTLVFDEIDTGISGEVAAKMAEVFQELGQSVQLVCITHLPQIAAKANQHLKVFKSSQGEKTESSFALLNKEERLSELAGMLSGAIITEEALANASRLFQG